MLLLGTAIVLSLSLTGVVSAGNVDSIDSLTDGQTGVTYVSYNVPSSIYHVSIPANFEFLSVEDVMNSYVNVTNVLLASGHAAKVTVRSEHGWKMLLHTSVNVPDGNKPGIYYNMTYYHYPDNSATITDLNSYVIDPLSEKEICIISDQQDLVSVPVGFRISDYSYIDHSGQYQDKLTFTVETVTVP